MLMFLITLSFLFSTPGWEPSLGGFPAASGAVGQFLIKDVVLLGAALWSLGAAMTATKEPAPEACCQEHPTARLPLVSWSIKLGNDKFPGGFRE
jgi:Protein of unknown function, DUF417